MNLGKQNKVGKQTIKEGCFFFINVCYFELLVHEGIICSRLAEFSLRRSFTRLLTWKAKILEKQTKGTLFNGGILGTVEWGGSGSRRTSVWKNIPPTSCILGCPLFILPIRLSYEVLSIKNIKASFQKYFIDYSHMSLLPRP